MEPYIKSIVVGFSGALSTLYGGGSLLLKSLLLFVAVDYITGLLASAVKGQLSSRVGRQGIAKKVMMFAMVATAHLIDTLIGGGYLLRDATITFYLCNEAVSILENSGQVGLPIPEKLQRAIEILKNKERENGD